MISFSSSYKKIDVLTCIVSELFNTEFCDVRNNYTAITNRVHRPFLVYDNYIVDLKN